MTEILFKVALNTIKPTNKQKTKQKKTKTKNQINKNKK
jgi:hypothetical protein